jgi:hypothetical protein
MRRSFRYTALSVQQIAAYARDRKDAATIAALMNCRVDTIENICRKHAIDVVGAKPSPFPHGKRLQVIDVPVEVQVFEKISHEAARRGVRPAVLIARLAEIAATDGLWAAVLDQ